jgi:hypothetical protein
LRTASFCEGRDGEEQAAALAVETGLLSGDRYVLAGETGNDAIHFSAKASLWEGSNVRPDRRLVQRSFFHARRQDAGCVSFPLNVANGAMCSTQVSKSCADAFSEHADSGEEFDGM